MGVLNGQPVDQTFTNAAFLDRRQDDSAFGRYTLANSSDPTSGASVVNIQQHINDLIQNSKIFLYSLTNQPVAYADGVITFAENLVIGFADSSFTNIINIASLNVNINDGQSMYVTLSRYAQATVNYTISSTVPKGKDVFRVVSRIGDGIVFFPNGFIGNNRSSRIGEMGASEELRGKPLTATGNPLVWSLPDLPASPQSVIINIGSDFIDQSQVAVSGQTVTFNPGFGPAPGQVPFALYDVGISTAGGGGGSPGFAVQGTMSSPIVITAAGGITSTIDKLAQQYVASSGGAVPVTATPQISTGSSLGQKMILKGTSDTDYPILNDGTGLDLNGPISLKKGQTIQLDWNGVVWSEDFRRG